MQELQEEAATKKQIAEMVEGGGQSGGGGGSTPGDVLEQANEIAKQLFPMDGAGRRQKLQEIKAQDQTLYAAVKHKLDEMTAGAKKQGVEGAKQQGQQGGTASQLFPLDGTQRRDTLAQLRQEDSELYDLVKGYLASFTPGANN
jgi:hypothetical protein